MKKSIILIILILSSSYAIATVPLYSVDRDSADLVKIDPLNGMSNSTIQMTLDGFSIDGSTGIALNPTTQELFVILTTGAAPAREVNEIKPVNRGGGVSRILGIVNPFSGVVTQVGDTGDSIAAISFAPDGTLYGVTGDGGSTSSTIFTINTTDGSLTLVLALGSAGGDGEILAYNPNDNLIYVIDNEEFYTVNPVTLAISPINTLGSEGISEATSIQFDSSSGGFFVVDLGDDLFSVSTNGVEALLGSMNFQSKGLAFGPLPPMIPSITTWGIVILAFGLIMLALIRRRQLL